MLRTSSLAKACCFVLSVSLVGCASSNFSLFNQNKLKQETAEQLALAQQYQSNLIDSYQQLMPLLNSYYPFYQHEFLVKALDPQEQQKQAQAMIALTQSLQQNGAFTCLDENVCSLKATTLRTKAGQTLLVLDTKDLTFNALLDEQGKVQSAVSVLLKNDIQAQDISLPIFKKGKHVTSQDNRENTEPLEPPANSEHSVYSVYSVSSEPNKQNLTANNMSSTILKANLKEDKGSTSSASSVSSTSSVSTSLAQSNTQALVTSTVQTNKKTPPLPQYLQSSLALQDIEQITQSSLSLLKQSQSQRATQDKEIAQDPTRATLAQTKSVQENLLVKSTNEDSSLTKTLAISHEQAQITQEQNLNKTTLFALQNKLNLIKEQALQASYTAIQTETPAPLLAQSSIKHIQLQNSAQNTTLVNETTLTNPNQLDNHARPASLTSPTSSTSSTCSTSSHTPTNSLASLKPLLSSSFKDIKSVKSSSQQNVTKIPFSLYKQGHITPIETTAPKTSPVLILSPSLLFNFKNYVA